MKRHSWTYQDDTLAFFLYRYGDCLGVTKQRVARHMGFTDTDSLNMRIGNFKALDGKGGLSNTAKSSKLVYDQFAEMSYKRHWAICYKILGI